MASTLTELLYHVIWSTKERLPLISPAIEENVLRILAAVGERNEIHVIRAGGIENHVHALVRIPKTMSVSEALQRLKGSSSKYINAEGLLGAMGKFAWQDGYAAFSVSKSGVPEVIRYIADQREHHRTRSFEDEFVAFLVKHQIDYDPNHLWD